MKVFYPFLFFLFLLSSCGLCPKKTNTAAQEKWLSKSIDEAKKDGYFSVDMYLYEGDTVYLFEPPCCDRFSELYDRNGKLICHPAGGITGKGDGKCPDFVKKAEKIKSLYRIDNEKR